MVFLTYCRWTIFHYLLLMLSLLFIARYNIFEEATAEVLNLMQATCNERFQRSEVLFQLLSRAQKEEAEMEALKKVSPND